MATRPLELAEYKQIIELFLNGFKNKDSSVFRPNRQIALALQLQASLGLRIIKLSPKERQMLNDFISLLIKNREK